VLQVEVPLDLAALEQAQERIAAWLDEQGVPVPVAYRTRLVIEELMANLIMHGRFAGARSPVRLEIRFADGGVDLAIEDAASPYDPRGSIDPAAPASVADDKVGGLGLPLVRRSARILDYRPTASGWNRTEMRIGDSAPGG
jgi:anti-sigma regulatory factor (Ser/Thr protein kinase)